MPHAHQPAFLGQQSVDGHCRCRAADFIDPQRRFITAMQTA